MRDAVQQVGEVACHVGVPGVGVDQVGSFDALSHLEVDPERTQRCVRLGELGKVGVAGDLREAGALRRLRPRSVEAADVDVDPAGEHCRQLGDVHTGSAVDVRGVLAGEEVGSHGWIMPVIAIGM